MTKSMFKRAWLSIKRKLSKTVILTVTMFIMANLVLASIAIKNAVNESTRYAKETLGSTVYLTADMDKVREEGAKDLEQNSEGTRMRIERPEISIEMVKAIGDSTYVKDFTYGITATSKETSFTALESDESSGLSFPGKSTNLYGNISIIGINSYAFINEVQNKTMELVDGIYFDENTNDKVIISNELAIENDLKVGDSVTLLNEEYDLENYNPKSTTDLKVISSKEVKLEIIGIYDINTDNFNGNTLYMNVETAAKLLKEEAYNDGNYSVDNVSYFLNNPENSQKFIKEATSKYPNLTDDKLKLDINSQDYDKMAGPIEQVGSFADTVLWIVIIASVLIITLIINNNIKDRKYEIGVLMSLGGTKKNIVASFLLELIVIGTIGFILSIGTSYFLADTMGKNLLEKQVKLTEEQTENNFGRPSFGPTGGGFQNRGNSNQTSTNNNVKTIDDINVNVNLNDYVILFGIGYLVSAVAMIVPSINIVKYEPKTILTGRQ